MATKLNLKDLCIEDRPREKFHSLGAESLSKSELIAILLGSGNKEKTAVELAQEILSDYDNNLNTISNLQIEDLCKYKGMGMAKAICVLAGLELARRKLNERTPKKVIVKSSIDAFNYARPYFINKQIEQFKIILLNKANQILEIVTISSGGRSNTVVDGKILFQKAILKNASSIILCHNHPSGNLTPSSSDILLTKKMVRFGNMIELNVIDHLILFENNYYSFIDEGVMPS